MKSTVLIDQFESTLFAAQNNLFPLTKDLIILLILSYSGVLHLTKIFFNLS